ncbi:hypothetical protein CDD82_2842 [Ophiocordyceps australis]|uniref:Uncharacterized protein n=1 Tax=Ophiocordyceps australis TaxID=1399860 RepID=A0A2C5ZV37_9HYPO|nr:hypothetical protein CDD82_2842 [Ophiocordyceps australis]
MKSLFCCFSQASAQNLAPSHSPTRRCITPPPIRSPTRIRAQASHWEHTHIQLPLTAPWDAEIPPSNVPRLLNGFIPRDMDDKWFIYAEDVDAQGDVLVRFCRSWTGIERLVLKVRVELDDKGGVNEDAGAKVTQMTWDGGEWNPGEDAVKEMAIQACEYILECELIVAK